MKNPYQPRKLHDKTYFYKYMPTESAKLVLGNRSLICRSPLDFNDPFDMQVGLNYGFQLKDLSTEIFGRLKHLVEMHEKPVFNSHNEFSKLVNLLRKDINHYRLNEDKIRTIINVTSHKLASDFERYRTEFKEKRLSDIKSARVLCLAEYPDNLLMWSHYANFHKGIVLRLAVSNNDIDDDPLWLAEKVEYVESPIPILTTEQMLDFTFGFIDIDGKEMTKQLTTMKSNIWKYENEWRIWTVDNESSSQEYYMQFDKERFDGVYFGCNFPKNQIHDFIRIGKNTNSQMKFYRAEKHESEFKLQFEQIDG